MSATYGKPAAARPQAQRVGTPTPPDLPAITTLIDSEEQNIVKLNTLLQHEQQHLAERNAQGLESTLEQKKQLLTQLAQNELARQTLLQQSGRANTPEQWRALLAHLDQQHLSHLGDRWQRLELALRDCRQLNETNGKIIKRSQNSITHVLDILRGKIGQPRLYNQRGIAGNGSGISRTITSA